MSTSTRRLLVIINFLGLLVFWAGFYLCRILGFNIAALVLGLSGLLVTLVSSFSVYIRTGLWRLVHTSFSRLDERQVQSVYRALRYSYSIFVIFVLLLFYIHYLIGLQLIDAILGAVLIYLAHILPAAIAAWSEKVV